MFRKVLPALICAVPLALAAPACAEEELAPGYNACMDRSDGVTADMIECMNKAYAYLDKRLNEVEPRRTEEDEPLAGDEEDGTPGFGNIAASDAGALFGGFSEGGEGEGDEEEGATRRRHEDHAVLLREIFKRAEKGFVTNDDITASIVRKGGKK